MVMLPSALRDFAINNTVGVGHNPTSITRHPVANSPASTACRIIGLEVRESRPTTTVLPPTNVPKASANRVIMRASSETPTCPRTPDTLMIGSVVLAIKPLY